MISDFDPLFFMMMMDDDDDDGTVVQLTLTLNPNS